MQYDYTGKHVSVKDNTIYCIGNSIATVAIKKNKYIFEVKIKKSLSYTRFFMVCQQGDDHAFI